MIILNFFTQEKFLKLIPELVKYRVLTRVSKNITDKFAMLQFIKTVERIDDVFFVVIMYPEIECKAAEYLSKNATFTLTDDSSWRTGYNVCRDFGDIERFQLQKISRHFDFWKLERISRPGRIKIFSGLLNKDIEYLQNLPIWKNLIVPFFDCIERSCYALSRWWFCTEFQTMFYPVVKDDLKNEFLNRLLIYMTNVLSEFKENEMTILTELSKEFDLTLEEIKNPLLLKTALEKRMKW